MQVGTGKTLVSFLAGRVLEARSPVLLLPASLIEKTEREWKKAMADWRVSRHLTFLSYQFLGQVGGAAKLTIIKPDLIIADECHKLKNKRCAVTRRVARYMSENPRTAFVAMSGTVMTHSIKDFAHILEWTHGESSPCPLAESTLTEWSEALDKNVNPLARRSPGVLLDLVPRQSDGGEDPIVLGRRSFYHRLSSTPAVVQSQNPGEYAGSLSVNPIEYRTNDKTEENFRLLRTEAQRPDGYALTEAIEIAACAKQIALGLHYEWHPPAPEDWLLARKDWAKFVRETLKSRRSEMMGWDSELQVSNAVIGGELADPEDTHRVWRGVEPTFTIAARPQWHDDGALDACAEWLKDHKAGIVWTEHGFFARELSKRTGVPYFGAEGKDVDGRYIEDASGPIIASRSANATGRNLQHKWSENLITSPSGNATILEQLLGRTHRDGQQAYSVTVDVLLGCTEHYRAVPAAVDSAVALKDTLGQAQKILLADVSWPSTIVGRKGYRWAE